MSHADMMESGGLSPNHRMKFVPFSFLRVFYSLKKKNPAHPVSVHRLNVVVNFVSAIVCPVSAQSMESRSAVGWVMSMSTAYNLKM